jgi:tRNA(fMet)-specific endonuclease VapC
MAKEVVLLDTSVLIDYFRKSDKTNSILFKLSQNPHYQFAVSSITTYEIYTGVSSSQQQFWDDIFKTLQVIPFNNETAHIAVELAKQLKVTRKQIDLPDLFIAATALQAKAKIATKNKKHFERITALQLI